MRTIEEIVNGQAASPIEIDDFSLEVVVNGKSIRLDLLVAELAIEKIERMHNSTPNNVEWMTVNFYRDLAAEFEDFGVEGCTPSQAFQLREQIIPAFEDAKKNMRTMRR